MPASQSRGAATPADQLLRCSAVALPIGRFAPTLTPANFSVSSLSPTVRASLLDQAVEGSNK
ncbi:hypothetical protein U1Q18_031258, partial [Sarracenia purpurea var. burkii]